MVVMLGFGALIALVVLAFGAVKVELKLFVLVTLQSIIPPLPFLFIHP